MTESGFSGGRTLRKLTSIVGCFGCNERTTYGPSTLESAHISPAPKADAPPTRHLGGDTRASPSRPWLCEKFPRHTALSRHGAATTPSVSRLCRGRRHSDRIIPGRPHLRVVGGIADYFDPAAELPPHRLVFNAVGDADLCRAALKAAAALVARSGAPVINRPAAVLETGRIANAARLNALPGLVVPRMTELARVVLAGPEGVAALASRGFSFPLLLRTPGFHTGRNFVQVETAAELAGAAAALPGDQLLVIGYLNARGVDGRARKYRVMIVDGRLYPLHLAISRHWKVHYFTADMADHAGHRAEDAAFLDNMTKIIGVEAVAALERIAGILDLDYAGIDFGLSPDGGVLLFEANATMVVNPPDPDERWNYRRPAVTKILDAVRAMMIDRARLAFPP